MKRVARTVAQVEHICLEIRERYQSDQQPLTVEYKKWVPPRTSSQRKKFHAMIGDLKEFTGDPNMKEWVKGMSFYPEIYIEHAGEGKMVPKSESQLSKDEESEVIEHLYLIGTQLPGFDWSEP